MVPSLESDGRRFAFLHRVLRGEFPCFNGTIKALRLPAARLAALRCLRLAIPRLALVLFAPQRTSTAAKAWSWLPGISHQDYAEETTGPPKFLENPNCPFAHVLRLRQDCHSRPVQNGSVAPALGKAKTPCELGISKLNSMAFGLAVYASWCGLLQPHVRLASSRWSDAAGWAFHPQGSYERFQSGLLTCSSSSPKLGLAQSQIAVSNQGPENS